MHKKTTFYAPFQYGDKLRRINVGYNNVKKIIKYLIIIISVILIFTFRSKLISVLTPFILGALLAYIIYPITEYFEKKDVGRSRSILITFTIILAVLLVALWLITPHIVAELKSFTTELPEIRNNLSREVDALEGKLNSIPGINKAINRIYTKLNSTFTNELKKLPNKLNALFSSFLNFILSPIIAFYILNDREKIYTDLYLLVPERNRKTAKLIVSDVDKVVNGYIRGQFYINLFVGLFTSIGLLALHVKLAVLLGILTGIFNFIPYFGPIIAAIPTVFMALLDSPRKALYALIIYLVVQEIESAVISPRILGENVGLHPLMVMFLIIFGQEFFGIWGMLLSVPLAAVIRVVLIRIAQI